VYRLVFKFSKSRLFSFAGGLLYGCSPIMISFVVSQHYYFIIGAVFFPLAVHALIDYFQTRKTKYAWLLCLYFWLTFFSDYNMTILYGVLVATFIGVVCVYALISHKYRPSKFIEKKNLVDLLFVFMTGFILPLTIFVILFVPSSDITRRASTSNDYPAFCNSKIDGFIVPSKSNPFLKSQAEYLESNLHYYGHPDTPSYFLGWSILILFIVAIFILRKSRYAIALLTFGIISFLFSLGTVVRFGDSELLKDSFTLFYWFSKLPFMGVVGCTMRYPIGTQFVIATLIGAGFGMIHFRHAYKKLLLFGFIFAAIILEYGFFAMPLQKVIVPSVYRELANMREQRSLLELPSGITESQRGFGFDHSIYALHSMQMYWQSIHDKPRLGGYLSRVNDDVYTYFKSYPIINDIYALTNSDGQWSGAQFSELETRNTIQRLNLGYIIVAPSGRADQFNSVIVEIFAPFIERTVQSDGYTLYILKR
jgi:hypothetical protein